jgi:hypothetical protein
MERPNIIRDRLLERFNNKISKMKKKRRVMFQRINYILEHLRFSSENANRLMNNTWMSMSLQRILIILRGWRKSRKTKKIWTKSMAFYFKTNFKGSGTL